MRGRGIDSPPKYYQNGYLATASTIHILANTSNYIVDVVFERRISTVVRAHRVARKRKMSKLKCWVARSSRRPWVASPPFVMYRKGLYPFLSIFLHDIFYCTERKGGLGGHPRKHEHDASQVTFFTKWIDKNIWDSWDPSRHSVWQALQSCELCLQVIWKGK